LKLSRQTGYREAARDASLLLAQTYAAQRKFDDAYAYQQQYIAYMDTLTGRNTQRQLTLLQYNYGLAEKQTQIALLKKDKALQMETAQRQQQLLLGALLGLVLILGLLFLVYRNNRQKQKANAILQQQKAELQAQRDQTNQALLELKSTQNQLIQSEKMASLGELTAGIAHEIQNPLNFVKNFSEVSVELLQELNEEHAKGPQRDEALEAELIADLEQNLQKISQHGSRASNIVRGMLEHSRKSSGQKEPTDLNALCVEYVGLAYHGLRAKDKTFNVNLVKDLSPEVGMVALISQDVGRVLLNLVTNAFYAVQQRQRLAEADYQPTVTIRTKRIGAQVSIQVADNGVGIPEELKQKIFQPFFTTKPTGEGTGLGLSLAYDIITKGHEGAISVESLVGQGTVFSIILPA
jgi:signal transduction histidine kinase